MPRGPRLDAPGVLHHVMARGIERRKIFIEEGDYQDFVERLGKVLGEGGGICYAWSLMPNHFHFLLRTGTGSLVRVMQRLMTGYAVNFNFRHRRVGHLFQNRYKSIICEEEPYLLELVRYIHLNPLRARLVAGIEGLDNYPWSGHAVLLGRRKAEWQEVDDVLGRFGDKVGQARTKYRRFVEEGLDQGRRPELQGGGLIRSLGGWEEAKRPRRKGERILSDARVLGGGDFVMKILKGSEMKDEKVELDFSDIVKRVASAMKVEEGRIKGPERTEELAKARALISYVAVERMKMRNVDVAQELGFVRSAVSHWVLRGRELADKTPGLLSEIERPKESFQLITSVP